MILLCCRSISRLQFHQARISQLSCQKKLSSSYDSSTLAFFFCAWQSHLLSPIHCTAAQMPTPAQTHPGTGSWRGQDRNRGYRIASFCSRTSLCKCRKCKCSSATSVGQQYRGPDAASLRKIKKNLRKQSEREGRVEATHTTPPPQTTAGTVQIG